VQAQRRCSARYTADTLEKELALITACARDAVATFLSPQYLQAKVTDIERKAGAPIRHPEDTVRQVAKAAKFSDDPRVSRAHLNYTGHEPVDK
jgi:hypothetical protein